MEIQIDRLIVSKNATEFNRRQSVRMRSGQGVKVKKSGDNPKIRWLVFSVMVLLIFPGTARSEQVIANLDDIAKAVETFFPKVTGKIAAIEGEKVVFNLGRQSGISNGLILTVYRSGDVFTHPLTGEILGRYEEVLGRVEVVLVEEESARGILLGPLSQGVTRGDSIRLTGGRVPLMVVPGTSKTAKRVSEAFSRSLSDTGRFRLVRAETEPGTFDPILFAQTHEIDYLLFVEAEALDEAISFNMKLMSRPKRSEIGQLDARLEPSTESNLILENLQEFLLLQSR